MNGSLFASDDTNNITGAMALATLTMMATRPAEALEHVRAALSRGAVDAKLLEIEARALVELGRPDEAAAVDAERRVLSPEFEPVPAPLLEKQPQ